MSEKVVKLTPEEIAARDERDREMLNGLIAKAKAFTWRGRWVDCASPVYGLYWRSWLTVRPIRRLVSGVYRRLRRIVGRRKHHVSDLP